MKTNKKHIIIPALMMAVGVGLVGSISGTVAWYQYSTRVQAAYIGTSVKATENTEIKVASGAWKHEYKASEVTTAISGLAHNGSKLAPITTGEMAATDELPATFKGNPIYQYAETSQWANALDTNYLQFKVYVRAYIVDGESTTTYLNKDVYLTDLTIEDHEGGTDLYKAVRVHFATESKQALFSAEGGSTAVSGKLDLNNDGALDKEKGYVWGDTDDREDVVYGDEGANQVCLNASSDTSVKANDTNATLTGGASLGQTSDEGGLEITVTIWLEGWQKLATGETGNAQQSDTAVWKAEKYIGADFRVGMRFAIQPVTTADLA